MMPTFVVDRIIESIRAGDDHDLHCHSMSLSAPNKNMPTFQGVGAIRIGSKGNLRFTMYARSAETYVLPDTVMPGDLIPDHILYRFSAIDETGVEWTSPVVLDMRVQPSKGKNNSRVTGDLMDLHSREPLFPEGYSTVLAESVLTLYVFDKVDIPVNTKTVTEVRVDGEDFPTGGASLNIAKVEVGDYEFRFTRRDDLLEIRVTAPTLRAGLDKRVIEALQFVLARPICWRILREESGDTAVTRIRSAPKHSAAETHLPPIQSVAFYDGTKCVWPLYAKYFEHILGHDERSWHPLSRYLYSAIEAHAAGFDTYRLALGVAVEGILKTPFKKVFSPGEEFLAAVDDLSKHFSEWKCPAAWEGESGLRERIKTYFTQLRKPRGDDQLRRLNQLEIVTDDEFRAWKRLRNKTAHGDRSDRLPSQEELSQIGIVTTLMYKLVFQAIGYSGKYTDYGTRGFPTRDFVCARD